MWDIVVAIVTIALLQIHYISRQLVDLCVSLLRSLLLCLAGVLARVFARVLWGVWLGFG